MNFVSDSQQTATASDAGSRGPGPYVLRARQLTKRFGDNVAVDALDLDVPSGGCFGLLGPNGAGKTTTLRMILGQSPLSGGSLEVMGSAMPESYREVRRIIGVVPQQDNLDPDFTVAENLEMYARYFGLRAQDLRGRIADLLALVELSDRADSKINSLSGGMKRRLSIARALINDPQLVVLDEPTTGLDPQVRHLIWTRLRSLKTRGKTLLLTTHFMEEAERLCDDLVIMDHGRVITRGSPRRLIAEHVEPDVLEVHDSRAELDAVLAGREDVRVINVGETSYCYTHDLSSLTSAFDSQRNMTWLHRPANLEDVFLRLTGHELRE